MNILERLSTLLGLGEHEHPLTVGSTSSLRQLIESARNAKFSERYDEAVAALDQALTEASTRNDSAGMTVILLQRADVLLRMGALDEADRTLDDALRSAGDQKVQIAYVMTMRGMVLLARGQPDDARAVYEQALEMAKSIGSPGAEGRARGLLGQVYLQDGNASYAAHLLRDAIAKLNLSGDVELTPLLVGLLGQATIENGQTAEGVHLIKRAQQLAVHLDDCVSVRRWSVVLGDRALAEARPAEAKEYFVKAFERAGPQPTAERVRIACALAKTLSLLHQDDEAVEQARQAVAVAAALDTATQAHAHGMLGIILRSAGRSAEAIPHLQIAIDTPSFEAPIEARRALALAYADAGDDAQALATMQIALHHAEQHGGPLEKAQTLRDLGLLHQQAGRPHEAIAAWQNALLLYEAESAHAQAARLYCDLGTMRKRIGQHQRGLRDYEKALTTLNGVDEGDIETRGLVLSNAANAFAEQGDAESADAFFNEAIRLAEKLGDEIALSTRRGNYAYFLIQTGRPRRAIPLLEGALRLSQAHDLHLQTAIQLDNLGLAHDASGEYAQALALHQQAFAAIEALDHPYWQAAIALNLAYTQLALAEIDEAAAHFERVQQAPIAAAHLELRVRALTGLGLVALRRHDLAQAAAVIEEAVTLAREHDLRRWLADALSARSELCAAQGSPDQAESAWQEAARCYNMLHMLQGKRIPGWLTHDHKA